MTKYWPALILMIAGFKVTAQNISFNGKVVDSLQAPIAYANVLAINPETQAIEAFAVTNEAGKFKLSLNSESTYVLKVSYIGYTTFEKKIITQKNSEENIIVMLEASTSYLDGVEIVEEMPVTLSGDTLIYKTEAFTNGRERKLGEVLEKLPGIEVDDNGEVKVQGKSVNKVLVEGKQFFDGDTKMATKNLPANAIDRVQVLKDYNEVGPMSGLRNDESIALNIQLREGKKNMLFGDVTAGTGPKERYIGHANMFYYSPKTNINLIADANNTGELAFTMQDYFRFSGGLSDVGKNTGTEIETSSDELGLPMANRENAQKLETKLMATNFNYNPGKKWRHSGFLIGSNSENTFGSYALRTYLSEETDNTELLNTDMNVQAKSAVLKYTGTFTPSPATHIQYSALGKIAKTENINNRSSTFATWQKHINEVEENTPIGLKQQLAWYHSANDKNVLSLENSYHYTQDEPALNISSTDPLFPLWINTTTGSISQDQKYKSHNAVSAFNYYRILDNTNHINFSLNYHLINQSYDSYIRTDTELPIDSSSFINNNFFQMTDLAAGVTYKTKWGPVIFSPSLFAHHYKLEDNQPDHSTRKKPALLLPSVYAKWNISSTQNITLRYNMKAEFANAKDRAMAYIISDYNALFRGNMALTHGLYHEVRLYYTYFNLFDGLNIFGNANYQHKSDDLINTVAFSAQTRANSITNSPGVNELFIASAHVDKRFNKYKTAFSTELNSYERSNFINNAYNENNALNQTYEGSIYTTLFQLFDLKIGYRFQHNKYRSDNEINTFTNGSPNLSVDMGLFENVELKSDYAYNTYKNQNAQTTSEYAIWNASLNYHKTNSAWEFDLSAYNLLNTRGIRQDSFNENLISTYEYYIQRRYVVASVKYNL